MISRSPQPFCPIARALPAALSVAYGIQRIENIDKEITVSLSSDYEGGEEWTSVLQSFAWGIAAVAILMIGGLGMMSAMVMSVLERTREIGALRAGPAGASCA